jgi:glutathione S-transferase
MKLFFAPFSCSLAVRILLAELGVEADYVRVDLTNKTLPDGASYSGVNPKCQVPALRTDDGRLLTEVAPMLINIALEFGDGRFLSPRGSLERQGQEEWLSFLSGEVHKSVYYPLFSPLAPDVVKEFARAQVARPYEVLSDALATTDYLAGDYSVADMLAVVLLSWTEYAGIDFTNWPKLAEYRGRIAARPAVRAAMKTEKEMFFASI